MNGNTVTAIPALPPSTPLPSHPAPAPAPAPAPVPPTPHTAGAGATPHAQPQTFHCIPCGRTIVTRESIKHLAGKPHRVAIETQQRKAQAAELRRKKQLATTAPPTAAPVVGAKTGQWECVVCQRGMVRATRTSHLSGAPHARMVLAEKEKQDKTARMVLLEKEKREKAARERERVLAEVAAADQRDADSRAAEKKLMDHLQAEMNRREADRIAELNRLAEIERVAEMERRAEIERVAEMERRAEIERVAKIERITALKRAAKKQQDLLEKEAEEQQQRKRDREEQEIAVLAQRQRNLIMEAERRIEQQHELKLQRELKQQEEEVKQQRESKQQKKKDRKAARQNAAIGSSVVRAKVVTSNGEDGVGGMRGKMLEFRRAQEFLRLHHLHSLVSQKPTTEYQRTGLLPMFITSAAELPPLLYRVYDSTSMSQFTSTGFSARIEQLPYNPMIFREMVERHANWSSRGGTPFVSVTSSADAARWHVSKKREAGLATGAMVAIIDTAALLRTTQVWRMHDAMDHFGVQPAMCERRAYDNEYICAVGIPAAAVVASCQPEYYMDMSYVFLKKLERTYTGRAQIGGRVVVTIRAPDADAQEAVAHGSAYWGAGYEIERGVDAECDVGGIFRRRVSV